MALLVLDTSVLITILQAHKGSVAARQIVNLIDETLGFTSLQHDLFASVVSYAELVAFAMRRKWSMERLSDLHAALSQELFYLDIKHQDQGLIEAYVRIDNYSRDPDQKHAHKKGPVTMGKNDLWIAATALNLGAELVTNDKDFNCLPAELLTVHRFDFPTEHTGQNT